ncbi:MAG: outer membrane beta-barrel family protein, partial [Bergeyella zoohelcum]|nr:outer membrane beta-barrel family protein [Bergeyella zoohelcum]
KVNDFNSDFQNYVTNNTQLTSAENNSYQSIKNYSLKADYELPLDWANLSFGGKTSSTTTESAVMTRFYNRTNNQLDLANDNLFEYTENIQALYLSANKQISEKIDAKIGLRGEYTQTKAKSISLDETNTNAYFKLFPTLYIAYTPNDNHTFSASYGRRIGRANFQQMNPARDYSTPKSYVLGNPFLQPSFINNYELGYSYKDLLNVQMYFGKMTNQLSQVTRHNPQEDSQIFRHENIADMTQAGGEFSLTFSPLKFWETSIETWFNYSETTPYDRSIYESKYYGWMVQSSMDNTFMLNSAKTLQATLTYGYHFPSKGIGRFDASSYLDIGFRYFALDKKLTLSLVFEDILRTASARHYDNTSNIPQAFLQYYDTQFARLSLSYEFGNKKISVKQRAIGNEEERNRSN